EQGVAVRDPESLGKVVQRALDRAAGAQELGAVDDAADGRAERSRRLYVAHQLLAVVPDEQYDLVGSLGDELRELDVEERPPVDREQRLGEVGAGQARDPLPEAAGQDDDRPRHPATIVVEPW